MKATTTSLDDKVYLEMLKAQGVLGPDIDAINPHYSKHIDLPPEELRTATGPLDIYKRLHTAFAVCAGEMNTLKSMLTGYALDLEREGRHAEAALIRSIIDCSGQQTSAWYKTITHERDQLEAYSKVGWKPAQHKDDFVDTEILKRQQALFQAQARAMLQTQNEYHNAILGRKPMRLP